MASLSFVITANITVCKVSVKPVYGAFQKATDKPDFKAKHEDAASGTAETSQRAEALR